MDDRREKKVIERGADAKAEVAGCAVAQVAHRAHMPTMNAAAAIDERLRLMAEFGIRFDGRHYIFDTCRHDHLADAVAFARLARATAALGPMAPSRKGLPRFVRRMRDAASTALSRRGDKRAG